MTDILLTIAGTDPSGAAGIQADLQVFRDFGFHGASVITSVLWQNTVGVRGQRPVELDVLRAQLDAVLSDLAVSAIKVGLVPTAAHWDVILDSLPAATPVVVDPVFASGDGRTPLVTQDVLDAVRRSLSRVDVVTPNAPEAAALTDVAVATLDDALRAAEHLVALGARAVLLKAGHLSQRSQAIRDVWADAGGARLMQPLPAIEVDVRGTGCQLSSAVAAGLARGDAPFDAAESARGYLSELLRLRRQRIGHGREVVVRVEGAPDDAD